MLTQHQSVCCDSIIFMIGFQKTINVFKYKIISFRCEYMLDMSKYEKDEWKYEK